MYAHIHTCISIKKKIKYSLICTLSSYGILHILCIDMSHVELKWVQNMSLWTYGRNIHLRDELLRARAKQIQNMSMSHGVSAQICIGYKNGTPNSLWGSLHIRGIHYSTFSVDLQMA